MTRALIAALWRPVALILGLLGFYAKGRSAAAQKAAAKEATAYRETRKEMDDVESNLGDDPSALRDWLRARDPGLR